MLLRVTRPHGTAAKVPRDESGPELSLDQHKLAQLAGSQVLHLTVPVLQGDSVIAGGGRGEALLLGQGGGERGHAAAAADVQVSVQQVSGRRHWGHAHAEEMRLEQLAAASKGQLERVLSLQL